jgi:hypothetical protein
MTVNDELGRKWKEVAILYFKVFIRNSLKGLGKTTTDLVQYIRPPGRVSNTGPHEYETVIPSSPLHQFEQGTLPSNPIIFTLRWPGFQRDPLMTEEPHRCMNILWLGI